jgi:hypothetical protein
MRRRVLSMAVLFGLASLADSAEVRATPTLSASITIEQSNIVQAGGNRDYGHHNFNRGRSFHHGKGFDRRHGGFHGRSKFHHGKGFARHHDGYGRPHRGYRHPDVYVARRPVVIVTPSYRQFSYRSYVAPRPLIKNGSFAYRRYW